VMNIDRGGGAYVRGRSLGYGGELVEAAIIPPSTYIPWPWVKSIPGPYLELATRVPEINV
jgi:hypothetical protein